MVNETYVERWVAAPGDPLPLATALVDGAPSAVLYERPGGVGVAQGCAAEVVARRDATELVVAGERTRFAGPPTVAVAAALAALPVAGWRAYGWAAFELAHVLHGSSAVEEGLPLLHLLVPELEARIGAGVAVLRARTEADLDLLEQRVNGAVRRSGGSVLPGAPEFPAGARVAEHDADRYRTAVGAAVARIRAGEIDKVILSRTVPVDEEIDLVRTYLVGRRANTPARSYLLRLGGWEVAGFSPEIVLTVGPGGEVTTQPLAGTRALVGLPDLDGRRRAELFRDAKEVFEHAISVRLAADELGAVCAPASVRIGEFMTVRERGSVQHLGSELSGLLGAGRTGWDAFAAVFPAVTASGVPKKEACALIREIEPGDRGLYGGAVLTVDHDGAIDAALVLRSVFRRGGRTWLRAGAGVVARSLPERELEETREKLLSVSRYLIPSAGSPRDIDRPA